MSTIHCMIITTDHRYRYARNTDILPQQTFNGPSRKHVSPHSPRSILVLSQSRSESWVQVLTRRLAHSHLQIPLHTSFIPLPSPERNTIHKHLLNLGRTSLSAFGHDKISEYSSPFFPSALVAIVATKEGGTYGMPRQTKKNVHLIFQTSSIRGKVKFINTAYCYQLDHTLCTYQVAISKTPSGTSRLESLFRHFSQVSITGRRLESAEKVCKATAKYKHSA